MAAKKAMKGKKSAKARTLHQGKKLESQKSLMKRGGGGVLSYPLTAPIIS